MTLHPLPLGQEIRGEFPSQLSISTWNVWFEKHHREERNRALLDELAHHRPHLMVFQEVTLPFIRALQSASWLQEGYWVSATDHSQIGVVMVGRLPVKHLRFEPLSSRMGRRLLVADFSEGLRIAGAHFESTRGAGETRAQQFREASQLLREAPAGMLLADFNCSTEAPESAELAWAEDAWPAHHPDCPGYTLDSARNPMLMPRGGASVQLRLDRILTSGRVRTKSIEMLGTEAFQEKLHPSDHFGLLAQVEIY